jgi:hypothetical protein
VADPNSLGDLLSRELDLVVEQPKHGAEVRGPEAVLVRTVQRLAMNHDRDEHYELLANTLWRRPARCLPVSSSAPWRRFPLQAFALY